MIKKAFSLLLLSLMFSVPSSGAEVIAFKKSSNQRIGYTQRVEIYDNGEIKISASKNSNILAKDELVALLVGRALNKLKNAIKDIVIEYPEDISRRTCHGYTELKIRKHDKFEQLGNGTCELIPFTKSVKNKIIIFDTINAFDVYFNPFIKQ